VRRIASAGPQQLIVAVSAAVDAGQPLGKQRLAPKGIFCSPSSGIWQPVWMEPVPAQHIDRLIVTPDTSDDTIAVKVVSPSSPSGAVTATVSAGPQTANGRAAPATGARVGAGDIVDLHMYAPNLSLDPWADDDLCRPRDPRPSRSPGRRVGGVPRLAERRGISEPFGRGALPSSSLTNRIVSGLDQMDAYARRDQSGSILTQLTDVENEDDGLLTYDRSRLKVSAARVAAANRNLIAAGSGR
jgi:hypothetical protein